jgi:amino acid transporter
MDSLHDLKDKKASSNKTSFTLFMTFIFFMLALAFVIVSWFFTSTQLVQSIRLGGSIVLTCLSAMGFYAAIKDEEKPEPEDAPKKIKDPDEVTFSVFMFFMTLFWMIMTAVSFFKFTA